MTIRQITCVNKSDRDNPWERIVAIGGADWKRTQSDAISDIESGAHSYYVSLAGKETRVIVAESRFGNKYLKTEADGFESNNLLSLPECP
jgi:hypothetical protein